MNEFSKEELQFINFGLVFVLDYCSLDDESMVRCTRMKIQSMIDNYSAQDCQLVVNEVCKHESDGLRYTSNPPQNKCKKCGKFYR